MESNTNPRSLVVSVKGSSLSYNSDLSMCAKVTSFVPGACASYWASYHMNRSSVLQA